MDADYLLFMARKAVCFYESLAALKLTELRGILVSDRILDMDLSWLRGKKVALIDDAVIYGSTLAKVAAILRSAGAIVSDTIVFCVNETSWKRELVEPCEPFLRLNEQETTGFCADLVRAISVIPMPYAVDYPVIRRLRISDQDLPLMLCLPGWGTKAYTTPLQFANSVSALACVPSPSKLLQMFPKSEAALANICQFAKIRLYGRRLEKHSATWFTLMPIVVFDPLTSSHVDQLWRCLLEGCESNESALLTQQFTTSTAKLRALQFVLAARIGSVWIHDINAYLGLKISPRIDSAFASFAFSPFVARLISAIAVRGVDFSAAVSVKPVTANMLRIEKPLDTYEPNPWGLQAALIKPFLDLHMQKEVPARQQRLPIDELPDPVLNRLNEGFSLPQLRQCVAAVSGTLPSFSILSEFLDYAIDRGFVVPISAVHKDTIFRAYRYGEDIRDAEQFRRLCCLCANSFLQASGLPSISRTWLEKLLVLLLQGLLDQNLLDPTDLATGSSGTIGVRYALHGAVIKEGAPRIYSHYDGQFYVDVLTKYGVFRRADANELQQTGEAPSQPHLLGIPVTEKKERIRNYVPNNSIDPIPDAPEAIGISESLGLLIGSLAEKTLNTQPLTLEDMTLLATCHSPASTSAALAAEFDILCEDWRFTEREICDQNAQITSESLRGKRWFTALNSARRKYRDYLLDVSDKKLDIIESELSKATERESKFILSGLRVFRRSRLTREKYSEVDPRYSLLLELGRLVYESNIIARLFILGQGRFEKQTTPAEIAAELDELIKEHSSILNSAVKVAKPEYTVHKTFISAVQRVAEPNVDLLTMRAWAIKAMAAAVEYAREYLLRVDHLVARVGLPNKFDLFPHVITIELCNPKDLKKVQQEIDALAIRSTCEFNRRQNSGRAYSFVFTPEKHLPGVIAVGFRGDASKGLFELFAKNTVSTKSRNLIKRLLGFVNIGREEQPLKSESSPHCVSEMFWQRAVKCLEHPLMQEAGVYRLEPSDEQMRVDEQTSSGKGIDSKEILIASPTERLYQVQFDSTHGASAQQGKPLRTFSLTKADVGIVCATASELRALKDVMGSLQDYTEEKKFEYFSATLPGDGCNHRLVMTYTTDQGNVSAAIAVHRFLTKYKPRMVVMLGMAGSVHDDARLLDVAISTQVIYYEPRKEREGTISNRLQTLPISPRMKRALTSFLAANGAPAAKLEYADGSTKYAFNVLEGPFGTGEAVVGAKNSAARLTVKQFNDKTLVVETEAWGVHKAVYENDSIGRACKHVLTIKGVADCADEEKDDRRQYRATRNAFETLRAFLLTLAREDLL